MKNAMELEVKGIKCDYCNYKNDNVRLEEYEKWLDKPCPRCGSNLLTIEDLISIKRLIKLIKIFNKFLPKPNGNEKKATFNLEMNGTGDIGLNLEGMEGKDE